MKLTWLYRKFVHNSWCWWTTNMVSWWNRFCRMYRQTCLHGVNGKIQRFSCIVGKHHLQCWGLLFKQKCVQYIYRVCWIIQVTIYFCYKIKYAHKTKTQQIVTYPPVKQINCNTDSKSKNYLLPFAFMKLFLHSTTIFCIHVLVHELINTMWWVSYLPYHQTTFLLNLTIFYWSVCTKPRKWAVIYMFVRGIYFGSFFDFSNGFWNCSDNLILFFLLPY